jgi:hypothetical protein
MALEALRIFNTCISAREGATGVPERGKGAKSAYWSKYSDVARITDRLGGRVMRRRNVEQ